MESKCTPYEENVKTFENRYGYIYLVTNLVNGKRYVGKTISTVHRRWATHISHAASGSNKMALHGAIRKYGLNSFVANQVCCAVEKTLCDLERMFIKYFNSRADTGYGYNLTDGGDGMSGHTPSEETRKKMSCALLGNKRGLGKKMSQDNKDKLIGAIKSKPRTKEHVEKLRQANVGAKRSPEHRAKMSEVRITTHCKYGHFRTPENTYIVRKKDGRVSQSCRECRLKVNVLARGSKRWYPHPVQS